jgi:hypothetical protein
VLVLVMVTEVLMLALAGQLMGVMVLVSGR